MCVCVCVCVYYGIDVCEYVVYIVCVIDTVYAIDIRCLVCVVLMACVCGMRCDGMWCVWYM